MVRETLLFGLSLAQSMLTILGAREEEAQHIIETFQQQHDEETLAPQAAVMHDENAFRQTAMDAAEELRQLFADDQSN